MTFNRPKHDRLAMASLASLASLSIVTACSHGPPADYAPDPALVAQIRAISITPDQARACPGSGIAASYEAVLVDGTRVPFQRAYDEKHPPRLHLSFLSLSSSEAVGRADGSWVADSSPLLSATTGFRLNAALKAKPDIRATVTVTPEYSCAPHAFRFDAPAGGLAQAGENGPAITVRIGMGRSPFYEKLIVAAIQVGTQAPRYELYDAAAVPPADWLAIETRGGRGGPGIAGARGAPGTTAPAGCPSQPGGLGGDGGIGGSGAPGGRGGPVTVLVPAAEPFIAGLVTARSPGGDGGPGGAGGASGPGGKGGQGYEPMGGPSCQSAKNGEPGNPGARGLVGAEGARGPKVEIITVPNDQLFGTAIPPELEALISNAQRRP